MSSVDAAADAAHMANHEPLFPDIDSENPVTEIESLCMNCHEQGITRLLLTKIPFFRNVVIMSFSCEHCHYSNNEIQSAESIEERGVRYEFEARSKADLNRQMIKSGMASISFPQLDFEIPQQTQRGSLNTVEGFLRHAVEQLQLTLDAYREAGDLGDTYLKLVDIVRRLVEAADGELLPLQVVLDDPSGNSFCENPLAPNADPKLHRVDYQRNADQQRMLGLPEEDAPEEVMSLPGTCPDCSYPGAVKMVLTDIPHFKQVLIMAFNCVKCGFKSNEVKGGGAVPPLGRRITLRVQDGDDLNRSVIKAETATVEIPEIELELAEGTLGGKVTTVEGLLADITNQLANSPFVRGDSADPEHTARYAAFISKLTTLRAGATPFTLTFVDPMANSYIQSLCAPDPDPQLDVTDYTRTTEEDEELGISDMRVGDEPASAAST